jgi:hypothetical protein
MAVLLIGACGSDGDETVARAETTSSTAETTSTTLPEASLPDGSPAPADLEPCRAEDLAVQTAFGVPVGQGPGLFVRLFNQGGVCWLDGHVKVSLRDDRGSWRDFTYRLANGRTTNGPDWTGSFDPALVGVIVFGEVSPVDATPTPYHGLRLTLPNGGGILQFDSAEISLTSDVLTVHPIEADSQDG